MEKCVNMIEGTEYQRFKCRDRKSYIMRHILKIK